MLADTVPIYPLYALLFADTGLSDARISGLFIIWTVVGMVAEVPTGALADRFSRRAALAAAGVLQAAGYALWIAVPGYTAFAAGFVLWGLGGAFGSGALEALLYDGLAAADARDHYPRVYGRVTAMGLLGQLPNAVAATLLFATGGYPLVGWASVACCLAAAALATRLPEARPQPSPRRPDAAAAHDADANDADADDEGPERGYLAVLRSGVVEAARNRAVRAALVAVAILGGLDAIDEYFPLLTHDWGVSTAAVPLATTAVYLVGAAGAALGGLAHRYRPRTLALVLALAVGLFCAAGVVHRPPAVAGMALAYGLYHLVLVVTDARLQRRIEGHARATVTSVASLGTELSALVVVAAWALGRPVLVAIVALAVATVLPRLLRPQPDDADHRPGPIG